MNHNEMRYGKNMPSIIKLVEEGRKQQTKPIKVGIFVCPGFMPMDINGAQSVFTIASAEIYFIWKKIELVEGYIGWPTMPTMTFDECPEDLDVLVVGMVPPEVVEDKETLAFFTKMGNKARYVIGTCYGSLVLGASGLLKGKKATSNSNVVPMLPDMGAIAVEGSDVVIDGNIYTSGPATGSFDASLLVLEQLLGTHFAQLVELAIEYDPRPPFGTGSPTLAGTELTAISQSLTANLNHQFHQAALNGLKNSANLS
ncbi:MULTISPECIES: DJ-1/PfpI family protein [Enterobacterales]|uniref:DJ-1/PfpI family protein n=1 Tax=Enterobacterales TaxID=91347 RepID=UPI0008481FAF|nr:MULTISPECIES: DJ-1/PfpI family protein [Enterobacterales]WOO51605.1 DJ-1/PfpI family protein [Hafnia alvei]MCK9782806.1 DJ-1/PfpI family protein [Proteus columbae]MCT6517422.1 DJ-1/PfpI family protein [Proteus vulgaris]ODQ07945.1 dihydroxy-acid dehydratase [Shigella sp. FC130]OEI95436.1 dihydroxy-acid dehydratase [Shigella sp. FC1655]